MMPPTLLFPAEDLRYPAQSSPEIRRADMYNRARREEMDTLLFSMNPRHIPGTASRSRNPRSESSLGSMFNSLRNGIGNVLVNAGNRLQNQV